MATAPSAFTPPRSGPTASVVSVVIPTLDAGPHFGRVLESLRAQVGLADLELVVLDSGSADGTCDRAREAGAIVVPIEPGEFGHGRTRNRGAEVASGSALLMLAQDAVLLGREALRSLVEQLEGDASLAAVSARQVPRSDADLYAAYVVFAHEFVRRDVSAGARGAFERLAPAQRRALAAVDDVCAVLRRRAWEQLRFSDVQFGEDVDFGIRAVEAGWRVAVHESAAVAHSHTRGAVYALRRSAADRIAVAPLTGDRRETRAARSDPRAVAAAGRALCFELASIVAGDATAPLGAHLRRAREGLKKPRRSEPEEGSELAALVAFLPRGDEASLVPTVSLLRADLAGLLDWPPLTRFARAHPSVPGSAAATFLSKLAGAVVGQALGDSVRRSGDATAQAWLLAGV